MKTNDGLTQHSHCNKQFQVGHKNHVNNDKLDLANNKSAGRMPPKAPEAYGIPRALMLHGQCCFPLWGMKEKPTPLSLMCGEPVEDGESYCRFHHDLCYRPTSNGTLDGDEA